jgi:hypothetical protein
MACNGTCEYSWDGTKWSLPVSHCSGTTCLDCPDTPDVPIPHVPSTVFIPCPTSFGAQMLQIKIPKGGHVMVATGKGKKPAAKKKKTAAKGKKPAAKKKPAKKKK